MRVRTSFELSSNWITGDVLCDCAIGGTAISATAITARSSTVLPLASPLSPETLMSRCACCGSEVDSSTLRGNDRRHNAYTCAAVTHYRLFVPAVALLPASAAAVGAVAEIPPPVPEVIVLVPVVTTGVGDRGQ